MEKRLYVFSDLCNGCRLCELICSFVVSRQFNPNKSYIKVAKIDEEGLSIPMINCDGKRCIEAGLVIPKCAELCPTGCIVFTELEDAVRKQVELVRKRVEQPIFKVIAPWKWRAPWRSWG